MKKDQKRSEHKEKPDQGSVNFANAAFFKATTDLLAGVILVTSLGVIFDSFLNSSPWGLIIGAFLGIVTGIWNVYKSAISIEKKFKAQKKLED